MLKDIKTIFFGTPDFAVPTLNMLLKETNIIAVITQPDKKVGRKQIILPSPIKKVTVKNNIKILQPQKIKDNKDFINQIKDLNPDIIIVAAYGKIIPKEILDLPKYGCINIHASLLPKYRGASPIQTAIFNGEKETGITIMVMNEKMDEGDIIAQISEKIYNYDTSESLHNRLSKIGAKFLLKILPDYINKKITPRPQDNKLATYTKIIQKEDGKINWQQDANKILRQINAFTPWPSAYTFIGQKRFKIIQAEAINQNPKRQEGTTFIYENKIAIACQNSILLIKKWQPEGKKEILTTDYLFGNKNIINKIAI
ncbi:MAG: methionyl-tRNA formyltransferase [Patescibacteria group bacterium]|nr:methionyl-tRNA formyltransferase [Patescibacteria group bacterium]